MRKIALVAAVLAVATPAVANDAGQPTAHVTRIGKKVLMPRRHIRLVRHFTPAATPTPAYVVNTIIPTEAARWHVSLSWLYGRLSCETGQTFRYDAHNPSGASGLGQFMPSTWARALRVWDTKVVLRSEYSVLIHRKVILLYSDGSRKVVKGHLVRRSVELERIGRLPRWPSAYYGWASVRATARAMAGIGEVAASEWACR